MDLVKKALVIFVAVLTLLVNVVQVNAASTVPSIEITGSAQDFAQSPVDVCDNNGGALSFYLPTWENNYVGSSTRGTLSVDGEGNVFTFPQNISVARNEAWVYHFNPINPYDVVSGTLMTATITTYFGLNQTGGVSYISEIIFECDIEGETISITNTAFERPPAPVPTLNEWGLIIFMALAGLGAVYYIRRKRANG